MAVAGGIAKEAGKAAVDVGNIFGQGGTDGLILYALILGTFLMFIMGVVTIFLLLRALHAKEKSCAETNTAFAAAANESAEALRELATSIASKNATDTAHHAALTGVMARLEGVLARMDPRNGA